jgi:hypothetical protein
VASFVTFLEHGVCPKCGARKHELILNGELNNYHEVVASIGQRSGKSAVGQQISAYVEAKFLKMQNPSRLYKQMNSTILYGTYVGLTVAKCISLAWNPTYNIIKRSPWFQGYYAMLADTGNRLGEEVARIKDTYRFYMHRNLNFYPAGPNKRLLRGDCVRGSTMINTNGGFYHINELISNKGFTEVTNMKVDTPNGAKKVTHLYKTKRKTIKIITRNGYSVSGTEEHPMLVLTKDLDYKWAKISELKVGDWIVSKTKYAKPLFGTRKVKLDEATVLGYHVANGCSNRCEISTSDPNVSERLCAAVKRLGGYVA